MDERRHNDVCVGSALTVPCRLLIATDCGNIACSPSQPNLHKVSRIVRIRQDLPSSSLNSSTVVGCAVLSESLCGSHICCRFPNNVSHYVANQIDTSST